MHATPHPLAGQTVKLKPDVQLPQHDGAFASTDAFRIEDWQDRVFGGSWMNQDGNPACLIYAVRSVPAQLPLDNEVVYGKDDRGFGHIVHVSEIEDGAV